MFSFTLILASNYKRVWCAKKFFNNCFTFSARLFISRQRTSIQFIYLTEIYMYAVKKKRSRGKRTVSEGGKRQWTATNMPTLKLKAIKWTILKCQSFQEANGMFVNVKLSLWSEFFSMTRVCKWRESLASFKTTPEGGQRWWQAQWCK